ncbi:MAG: penicillin acylase family protein [Proteobacteria bacterium]|nr:penicillin acylase family protein [Pseudomonadota bacterium]
MSDASEKRPYVLKILGTWSAFLIVAVLLSLRLGSVPPLGHFLSPHTGYLQNSISVSQKKNPEQMTVQGLKGTVTVRTDVRGVPHVTAENDDDLAFGQGYATARDRLWQMELQTAATAGRVSEILGERALQFDVMQRRMGFLAAAQKELEFIKTSDPDQYQVLESYSAGVNAFINSLSPRSMPVEYKLLGAEPELWTPLKCALFHKQMAWTLTGNLNDFKMSNALQKFSPEDVESLFPDFYSKGLPILEPAVAQVTAGQDTLIEPQSSLFRMNGVLRHIDGKPKSEQTQKKPASNGSNNWVVDGVHMKHGYPVLANDPHLDLKLPSIWYEIQLTSPSVNVYGVSLPGLPHVIIGFNESVSWGITNAGTDVLDWYAMKFDKTKPAPQYFHGQQWKPSTIRKEIIQIKGQPAQTIDVIETHLGPVAKEMTLEQKSGGEAAVLFAMKWTGHEPSNEFRVFHNLNRAHSVLELKNALQNYKVPGQNFVLADKTGSIGYVQAGLFPARSSGFGRYLLDGTNPDHDWRGYIRFNQLPQSWSPERGFLASANQQPTRDPHYGYASGDWGFTSYLRGSRINHQLSELTGGQQTTVQALMGLQNDVVDLRAKLIIPLFIRWTAPRLKNPQDQKILDKLAGWNFELQPDSQEAAVWSKWWDNVYDSIWEKAFPKPDFLKPSEDRTTELLLSENSGDWPAVLSVPKKDEIPALVAAGFEKALHTLRAFAKRNELGSELPAWSRLRGTRIPHLANLGGFGIEALPTGGSDLTVNATTDHHGPSWRMVVTWVDAQPKAWGIYPGGQSGQVGSPHYSNMIKKWLKGELDELHFVRQGNLNSQLTLSQTILESKK